MAAGAVVVVAVAVVAVVRIGGGPGEGDGGPGDAGGGSPTADGGWASAAAAGSRLLATDGEIVCSTTGPELYCLDGASGGERFTAELPDSTGTSPVLAGDRVLVGSSRGGTGHLLAYSREGAELWNAPREVRAERDLPVVGDVVAVVDDGLMGVDVATGDTRWSAYTAEEVGEPQVAGTDVYADGTRFYAALEVVDVEVGEISGNVVAVDPGSGTELWRSPPFPELGSLGIAAAAPFEDGTAVAFLLGGSGGVARRVVVLDAATGAVRWEVPVVSDYASIVHLAGTTFVADGADMRAYGGDGQERWAVPAPVVERSPDLTSPGELVADQGRLFAVGYHVFEVDPADGTSELVREGVSATDVAVAGDHLVIAGSAELEAVPL